MTALEPGRAYLAKVPPAISGNRGHDRTFGAACWLRRKGYSAGDALVLLAEWNCNNVPPFGAAALRHKIQSAYGAALPAGGFPTCHPAFTPAPTWPVVNEELRASVIKDGPALADLYELSPVKWDTGANLAEDVLDVLFPDPQTLLCIGQSKFAFWTRPREWFRRKLRMCQFIVPSPMSAITGATADGRQSEHTLSNTGPRRFLVFEFDTGSLDDHAALLWHLARFMPLTLAVYSGGKGLHGWYYVAGQPEDKLRQLMSYAVSIGADKATWLKSQFVRLPDGLREDNQRRQSILFLNPKSISQ